MAASADAGHAVLAACPASHDRRAVRQARGTIACAVAVLLAVAACSGGDAATSDAPESQPAQGATTPTTDSARPAASKPTAAREPGGSRAATTTENPAVKPDGHRTGKPADGEVTASPPRPGSYVYSVNRSDPSETFTDRVRTRRVSGGHRIIIDSRSSRSSATAHTVLRWQSDRVLLEATNVTIGDGLVFDCPVDVQVELVRFPLKPERYPLRQWRNDQCSGAIHTRVAEFVDLKMLGRSWRVARMVTRMTVATTSADGEHTFRNSYTETRWFSVELGKELQRDRSSVSDLDGHETSSRIVPVLRDYPS